MRAFKRIGLIEDRQYGQSAIRKKSLDGYFPSRYVTLDKHLIEVRLASGKNLRGFEQPPDTSRRREKLLTIVRAHDALARRQRKRLQHTGIRSEEHTSELQSQFHLVCRLLL